MVIVDKDIKELLNKKELVINVGEENPPFNPEEQIGPSSIDLRLGRVFRKYTSRTDIIDLTQIMADLTEQETNLTEEETDVFELALDEEYVIQPGETLLALTVETITVPAYISGFIAVRSSVARSGLSVVEQPLIHPGYSGAVALQLKNNNINLPIKIKPLLFVCQVMFTKTTNSAEKPYDGQFLFESRVPLTSKKRNKNKRNGDELVDFALVTALPKERDALLKHLDSCEKKEFDLDPLTYYRGRIYIPTRNDYYEVVVIMPLGMGNVKASFASMDGFTRWRPANVILAGIAGGVSGKVTLGDIVVADFVYYYELMKRMPRNEQIRGQFFPSDRLLYGRALGNKANDWISKIGIKRPNTPQMDTSSPKVHFGAIGSGEKIIADERALKQLLKTCPELLAVAMEGAGVAGAASYQLRPRFLEIRSICDYANVNKNDDWQEYAAEAAAAYTISLLRSGPVPCLNEV
jgi:deoxycytidine triphosphate deaminase